MSKEDISPGHLMIITDRSLIVNPFIESEFKKKEVIKWFLDMCTNVGVRDCNERIGSTLMAVSLFEGFLVKYKVVSHVLIFF